jgi:hypothetical protein
MLSGPLPVIFWLESEVGSCLEFCLEHDVIVTTAIITAGSALFGVILGQLLSRAAEHRRWFRQELHEACIRLLTAAEAARAEFVYVAILGPALREQLESDENMTRIRLAAKEVGVDLDSVDSTAVEPLLRLVEEKLKPGVYDKFGRGPRQQVEKAREVMEQVVLARHAVRLLGPEQVVQAGNHLSSTVMSLQRIGSKQSGIDELDKGYLDARDAFVEATRRALIPSGRFPLFR